MWYDVICGRYERIWRHAHTDTLGVTRPSLHATCGVKASFGDHSFSIMDVLGIIGGKVSSRDGFSVNGCVRHFRSCISMRRNEERQKMLPARGFGQLVPGPTFSSVISMPS